jgi:hypothetical protein
MPGKTIIGGIPYEINTMTKEQTQNEAELSKAEQANKAFIKKVTKRRVDTMGENFPDVKVFLDAIERVTSNTGQPFSVYDVIRECKGSDTLDAARVTELFAKWLNVQERFGRVTSIDSIMDYPLFIKLC